MRVKDFICHSGRMSDEENEDLIAFSNYNYMLLMDGSTGLGKQFCPEGNYRSSSQWFVNRFAQLVELYLDSYVDLKDLVKRCVRELREEYDAAWEAQGNDGESMSEEERRLAEPSASVALVRKREDKIDMLCLGDLFVYAQVGNPGDRVSHGVLPVGKIRELDRRVLELVRAECERTGSSVPEVMRGESVQTALKQNRLLKNSGRPEGYWILGLDEEAVDYADIYCWPEDVSDGADRREPYLDSMLVCSDGFSTLYEYESGDSFFEEASEGGLQKLYKKLRRREEEDSLCEQFPRFKKNDDAAAVLLHFRRKVRTYDKEEKKTKLNLGFHRVKGRLQSAWMSFGLKKSYLVTMLSALFALVCSFLKWKTDIDSRNSFSIEMITITGTAIAALYSFVSTIVEYNQRSKGILFFTDRVEKRELQERLHPGAAEKEAGYEVKQFFNGTSWEYYSESGKVNSALQSRKRIPFRLVERSYRLPEEVRTLVPAIMEGTFRSPNLIFNGELLRQASHIDFDGPNPSVVVQKVKYFDGQCSHEIVYKQFVSPDTIGVAFHGKGLLADEEDTLYNLNHSPCANFLGASTLVITRDNKLIIGKQAGYSKANKGRYAPSGSGSVDYADIKKAAKYYGCDKEGAQPLCFNQILTYAMEREFCEECNYSLSHAQTCMRSALIGYVRLLERGGKPDYFGLSYLDDDIKNIQKDIKKSEYGLVGRMVILHFDDVNDIPQLLEEFCQRKQETKQVSIQLFLITKYLKQMQEDGMLEGMIRELRER